MRRPDVVYMDRAGVTVTADEIARVHRYECTVHGHAYQHVEEYCTDGPVAIVCSHCGARWKVEPA